MKIALRDDPNMPDTGLSIISDHLPNELRKIYDPSAKHSKGIDQEEVKGNVLEDNEGKTIGHRRKQLRQKFFGHESVPFREQNVSTLHGTMKLIIMHFFMSLISPFFG